MTSYRHTVTLLTLATTFALAGATAVAQHTASPYAGEQTRTIKSLSEQDVTALIEGQGAGLARAAELNGYPGPMHTLELKEQLVLLPEQVLASQLLMTAHKARAQDLGRAVVEAERRLDLLFANKRATANDVESVTREVGELRAQLRAEHLKTHLTQTALLSPTQIQRYAELRGYDGPSRASPTASPRHSPAHKHHH